MEAESSPPVRALALKWALVLGAIGFACGYFGPIMLSPESNQGPLLGIFISGPGGAVLGFMLGLIAGLSPFSAATRRWILQIAGLTVALATLYFSTPPPAYVGRVIDAEIAGCMTPVDALPAAIEQWQASIAKVTWASPRAGWKEEATRLAQTDSGVVLELRIRRERAIYENKKPWNKGSVRPAEWHASGETRSYYARHAGAACAAYTLGKREIYFPVSEREAEGAWPSKALPNFLNLQVLGPVPLKYQALPGDGQ